MLNSLGHVESKCASFRGNVEYVEYVEFFGESLAKPPLSSSSPKNIQHIQHIQHFCSFKHILVQHAPQDSTYSTFPLKEAHF